MDPSFIDDYGQMPHRDYMIRHGRRAGTPISKRAEKRRELARILNSRHNTHRKATR